LGSSFTSEFAAIADLTKALSLEFSHARSDRATQTVSYEVRVTNVTGHDLLLPLVLELDPQQQFDGVPVDARGQAPNGAWLIDLSASLPGGVLAGRASIVGRTITVRNTSGQRVNFDPGLMALPGPNAAPFFTSQPITIARAGNPYTYQVTALDPDGDALSFLLIRGPDGMALDAATGLLTWTPTRNDPALSPVILQVFDALGGHATQAFFVNVEGGNRAPIWEQIPGTIRGREGQPLQLFVRAADPDGDRLLFQVEGLPPGAVFDPDQRVLTWTPDFASAGTYDVRFSASDGVQEAFLSTTLLIAPVDAPPVLV